MTLVPGFNLEGIIEINKIDIDLKEIKMKDELKIKKVKKINFDKLFLAPKNNENMGMDDLFEGESFEGVL